MQPEDKDKSNIHSDFSNGLVAILSHWQTPTPQSKELYFKYGESDFVITIRMSTDGTKTFSLDRIWGIDPENVELVDSGITDIIDSNWLNGWVTLQIHNTPYTIDISFIRYTAGGFDW